VGDEEKVVQQNVVISVLTVEGEAAIAEEEKVE